MSNKFNLNGDITRESLEHLDPEDLVELIALAEETEKQANKTKVNYVPNSVQEKFHKSTSFIRALFSGNGAGKTTGCLNEAIWTATGTHPYRETSRIPNTTIIVLDDPFKADTVYITELRKRKWYSLEKLKLDKHGRPYTTEIVFPNGSNIVFMGHEVGEDKWESIQCAGVIFDEPPPRFIFIALLRGMRELGIKPWVAFAGTPRGKNAPWMYRELYRPWKNGTDPEIECFGGSTYQNLHNLESGTIERWKKRFTAEELKTRVEGEFEFLTGRVFPEFHADHHIEKPFIWPMQWPVILALDPHVRKDHHGVLLGVDPDKELHVIKEFATPLAGRRAAEYIIKQCDGFNIRIGICDNYGSMPTTGGEDRKSFIDVFNETSRRLFSKITIRATTRQEKSDDEWIEDMRDWLRLEVDNTGMERPRFHIFSTCVKTIDNFESYIWDEHKGAQAEGKDVKEKPLGTDCDFLMCVKYGIATKPDTIGRVGVVRRSSISKNHPDREYESNGLPTKPWMKD
ncbi:large terminase protein [Caudoviricetes sp.]|nr:large terminase protein [Caudoviricetes sp.]UOF79114.1 large terminase protein [Caudoviricetes sp.]